LITATTRSFLNTGPPELPKQVPTVPYPAETRGGRELTVVDLLTLMEAVVGKPPWAGQRR